MSADSELECRIAAELIALGLAGSATESLVMQLAHNVIWAENVRESNAAAASLARIMGQIGALLPRTGDGDDPLTQHLRAT